MAAIRGAEARRKQPQAKVLKYTTPNADQIEGKALVRLAQSGIMFSAIQIIEDGGDNNLHSHAAMDGLWFVLKGQARFYGTKDDVVIAELGPHQGIFIPRDFPYWFEKIGEERLELLQVEAIDRSVKNTRTDYKEQKESAGAVQMFDLDGTPLSQGIFSPGLDDGDEEP
jgi:mannose-6-phosphate isomerase-like protein (cupin superfamily)